MPQTDTPKIVPRPDLSDADLIWPESATPLWVRVRERVSAEALLTFAVVAACVIFTFVELQPSQLLKNTTAAGGDMGAHVWLPAFVKRALFPHLQLNGWAPDWYDGFPALTYYFPLPVWVIALLSYVIPYNIAFKLITVVGLVTLPAAAWAMGRLARMRFPFPAVLAAATLPYLFANFGADGNISGGNIASTMAGEFSFSISLSLAVLFLGLFARGLQDGRHRASAAVVLVCCGLCHILPLFFALGGAVVLTVMSLVETRDWRRLRWAVPVLVTAGLVLAFWALPFYWRLPYSTNMGYGKLTNYMDSLFPSGDLWLIGLAAAGFLLAALRSNRFGVFLGFMTVLSGLAFCLTPASRLWNARALPFWFLCLYLLAGVGVCEVLSLVVEMVKERSLGERPRYVAVPIIAALAAFVWVLYPLRYLPFGHTLANGKYDWLGITSTDDSFIPDWVYWNYSGYQNSGKTREAEYFALVAEMKKLGRTDGCGQALWEYEPELNDMGTPDALMLLPYWTDGCIGSEEGLYYESSATTPYHFLNVAEVSDQPSDPVRGLDYASAPDVTEAVAHMQMNADRYFMAETPDVEAAADADPDLKLVATVGPYPVSYTTGSTTKVEQRTWDIYQVLDSDLVTPLVNQPVVMKGVQSKNPSVWLDASEAWYLDPDRWDTYEAASGPKSWARVSRTQTRLPTTPLPEVQVSDIKQTTQSISFDVDRTGVPVLVHESYFPNWQVKGGTGPYRVTPNLMVVIPTSNHVTLDYGTTPVDWAGTVLTIGGFGVLGFLWKADPVAYLDTRRRRRRVMTWTVLDDDDGPAKVPDRMAPHDLDRIFKAYDIRGTVPDQLDADVARAVGEAFARHGDAARIVVARDMRPSGVDLAAAFSEGVASTGVDVVDLGLCSTDEMYFASGSMNAPGAMFTASHNPARYNGIKLCRAGARPIGADTGLREIQVATASILNRAPGVPGVVAGTRPGSVARADVLSDYAAKVRSFADRDVLRPLKVVADTANGMGGLVVPAVFEGLPFRLEILFGELDGTFPNHPADPIQPENQRDLQARILAIGADVGLAFDGDADRCFLVDDRGVPLSGSTTTALVAAAMLEKNPGATILHNLICSKAVPEIIKERGGTPVRTRVGHSYIKAVMADTDALFGGEHSGHYYFRDNFRADSGSIAALVVLEVICRDGRPLSEIRRDFERYADSGEINTVVEDQDAVIEAIAARYSGPGVRQDRLDGLTVDLGDWWFNVRPSNTEPLLRLNLEAPDRATCEARTAEVLSLLRSGGNTAHGS